MLEPILHLCPHESPPATHRDLFVSCSHQAPHPQTPSVGRCRPGRNGNRRPRPLKVEETRHASRIHQVPTVPGSYRGGLGSQRNVAYLLTVFCWVKYRGRYKLDMIMVLLLLCSADTAYQSREQGPFLCMIHPCLHPARRREVHGARRMCTAAILLPLLLRLLLLLMLWQLLRGCDQNRQGDPRLGGYAAISSQTKQKITQNCKRLSKT